MPLSERKLPISDEEVAARLDAGTSQRALAAELSAEAGSGVTISRAAVRNAAARYKSCGPGTRARLRVRPVATSLRQGDRTRGKGDPPRSRDLEPVGSSCSEGYGPAWWLERRDAERAVANDPEAQAIQREIDRQTRLAANHGLDPLIPDQARQIAELRRAERRLVDRHPATWPSPDGELVSFGAAAYPRADSNVRAAAGARRFRSKEE